VSRYFIL